MSLSEPPLGGLEPTPIRQGGPPARAVIGVFAVGLFAVIGIGVFGQPATPPTPERTATPSIAAVSSPTPFTPPTPTPLPTLRAGGCQTGLAPITGRIEGHQRLLKPPPLVGVAAGGGVPYQVVASGDAFWSIGPGQLTRMDPVDGTTQRWDYLDDPTFGSYLISPARGGGVWLSGLGDIRWFDGFAFADSITSPTTTGGGPTSLAEAPDGSVWATVDQGGAERWDGVEWTALCDDPTIIDGGSSRLAFASDGSAWVLRGTSLIHYDATGAMLGSVRIPDVEDYGTETMTVSADGSVWVASSGKIQRFDGRWTTLRGPSGAPIGASWLTAADDGSVWAASGPGDGSCCTNVVRFDGTDAQLYATIEGLGRAAPDGGVGIWTIAVHGTDVVATTSAGTYRIPAAGAGAWTPVGPAPSTLPEAASVSLMVADGTDRLLAVTGDRLWEVSGGRWTAVDVPGLPPGFGSIDGLARSADGAIAIGTSAGALVRSGGRWQVLEPKPTLAIAFDAAGACWLAPGGSDPNTGETLRDHVLYRFTQHGGKWVRSAIAVPDGVTSIESLAVGPDGDVWLRGMNGDTAALWQRHGKRWVRLPGLPGTDAYWSGRRMAVTTDGDLIVAGGGTGSDPSIVAYRYDGTSWSAIRAIGGGVSYGGGDLAAAPDGTVWVSAWGIGLTGIGGPDGDMQIPGAFLGIAVDARGTTYVAGSSGIYRVRR